MTENIKIIDVSLDNISKYPATCFMKSENEGYQTKLKWLKKRFSEGLKIKLLFDEVDKKIHGFIEYVPGDKCWRAVSAKDYTFIHCLWIYPNKYKQKGYGSLLIKAVKEDTKKSIVVVASDDSFMASKDLFLKNGFKVIETNGNFQLLVTKKEKVLPKFNDFEKELKKYEGLNLIYSNQCPWVARFVGEMKDFLKKEKVEIKIKELKNPKDAQKAPSIYGAMTLIKDGKMLVDHYISMTRFKNILKKEKLI